MSELKHSRVVPRTREHILETMSERALVGMLPGSWTDHPNRHDYGIDIKVEIFDPRDNGDFIPSGDEFAVQQLKATDDETARRLRVGIDWSHIEYWQSLPYPTLVVRYCATNDAIYAMWAHDRSRTAEGLHRRRAWFHFTDDDQLTSGRWPQIPADVRAVRRAREGRIRLPLRVRLEGDGGTPSFQLKANSFFNQVVGRNQLLVDSQWTADARINISDHRVVVDFGGGIAIAVDGVGSRTIQPVDIPTSSGSASPAPGHATTQPAV